MSTSDREGGDVERVDSTEGEEEVPPGSAEEVAEEGDGGMGSDVGEAGGPASGDLSGGGWTESGGHTESGAEVESTESDAGGATAETGGGMTSSGAGAGDLGSAPPDEGYSGETQR